ncbi:Imm1 family immunity protein [Actinokineospora iranica]|uniref:Immunity protein Imm1 n=1 Tax=Actinokineospora iranica TaxID=1271860 RepID=A0A1G6SZL5_9PSEU|nr:Imm1 family immunity protein [Actinokineospora iranica]SDD22420.1 Immunity protein Imm1 [Actinokineospora iranica]
MTIEAWYERGGPNVLHDLSEVSAMLESVRADSIKYDLPLMTHWYVAEDGDSTPEFSVGVHGDVGALSYSGREWHGLWFSKGEHPFDGELLAYSYQDNERPVPANSQIPFAEVVKAALEFFQLDGNRPASVTWQKLT